MHADVSDRLVVRGSGRARVGVVLEVVGDTTYRVRWEDGHESLIVPGPGTTVEHDSEDELRAEWEAAKAARHARTQGWRRGIVAGVGRDASVAQRKIGALSG